MLIVGPAAALDALIVEVLESCHGELGTLGDNLCIGIVLDALRGLILCKRHQAVDKHILQVVCLCLILLVNLCKGNLILLFTLTGLDST